MSNYTLSDLIDHLQSLIEHEGVSPDAEVLIAYQPHYPMESDVADVTFIQDQNSGENLEEMQGTVYLAASGSNTYSTPGAWEGGVITKSDLA